MIFGKYFKNYVNISEFISFFFMDSFEIYVIQDKNLSFLYSKSCSPLKFRKSKANSVHP